MTHNDTTQRFARTTKVPTYSNQYEEEKISKKEIAKAIGYAIIFMIFFYPLLFIVMSF